ncbi:MAG: pirin family protein [Trebonia sp.]
MHAVDVLEAREAAIGDGTEVRRLLPQRELRTIGAWCFLDHYGPDDTSAGAGMQGPPHPHIGLQTASWLFDGLVLHRDSLGREQLIRPGELNLMTSGWGIAHIMWWNFVARTGAEITEARDAWIAGGSRFGTVRGYPGNPLPAPPLPPGGLKAR